MDYKRRHLGAWVKERETFLLVEMIGCTHCNSFYLFTNAVICISELCAQLAVPLDKEFQRAKEDSIHAINFDLWSHSKQPQVLPGLGGKNLFISPLSAGDAVMHSSSRSALLVLGFGHVLGNVCAVMLSIRLPTPTGTSHSIVHSSGILSLCWTVSFIAASASWHLTARYGMMKAFSLSLVLLL